MPVVKISHVLSFSSEDTTHVAENLLKKENVRKWNCAVPGEKTATVILQLEKATKIDAIDIGNDGSAFVEVLVGRSGSQTADGDYQVLLVTSSFMSPSESKSSSNTNRVRMFGKEKLSQSTVDQKWDRVKIVCTQPYNKNVKYGLVFVQLHGPSDESKATSTTPKQPVMLGAFKLRDDTDNGSVHVGSMFDSQKVTSPSKPSIAASARAASTSQDAMSRVRDNPSTKQMASASKPVVLSKIKDTSRDQLPAKKRKPESKTGDTASAQFNDILKGVRFALSGFKNPYRRELRDKALAMGAKYEPDWGPKCTHLVCAFPNTPKFNQVKAERGAGIIIGQEWIVDCHKRRVRLPSSRYTFEEPHPHTDTSSESQSDDERPPAAKRVAAQKSPAKKLVDVAPKKKTHGVTDDVAGHSGSTDEMSDQELSAVSKLQTKPDVRELEQKVKTQSKTASRVARIQYYSDSEDTDDEIRRVQEQKIKQSSSGGKDQGKHESGDVDVLPDEEKDFDPLPDLFTDQHFLLYGDFDAAVRRRVTKYIIAYNGTVDDYMNDAISYVITASSWNDDFDSALADNASLSFVKPQWIFACHEHQKLFPHQKFAVVPV